MYYLITNSLEYNSKYHKTQNTDNKCEEPEIIMRTNAISYPRTMVIVYTYASSTYLAMS